MLVLRPRQAGRTRYALLLLVPMQFYRRSNQQQPLRDQQATLVPASEKKATSLPSGYLPARQQAVGHLPPGCRRRLRSYRRWSHRVSVRNERRTKVHHSSSSTQRPPLLRPFLLTFFLPAQPRLVPSSITPPT